MEDIDVDAFAKEAKEKVKGNKFIVGIVSVLVLLVVVFLILLLMTVGYKRIYGGVSVNGVALGGMTLEEAQQTLNNQYKDLAYLDISVRCNDYRNDFRAEDISASFDVDSAVNTAYAYGRDGNLIDRILNGLKCRFSKNDLTVDVNVDRKKIESEIAKVTREVESPAIEWSYAREGDKLLVKNGVTGIIADKEAARLEIISKLDKMVNMLDNPVNIKTEEVHPEKVDIDKIQKQITKKVQNAEYISDTGNLIEQIIGIEIEDVDQAKKLANSITEEGMQFSIPLLITMPEITTENVLGELFRDKLSTYTTYFNVNEVERTENVRLAAEFIDDVILMPGQEFSYNNIVGERSTERGFKTAKVYQQGQVVDGLGGGICQVSSTLYNAVVMADLEVLERKNHSLSVSYVKLGRDATVVYGSIDFRFKNSRQYPIKISSKISGGTLTIEIYGYNTNKTRLVDIETEVIEVLPFKEQEIQDATMPVGTSKITTTGHKGYKVKSYRVTTENGEVVERKFIATDTYSPVAQVKRVGIAAN